MKTLPIRALPAAAVLAIILPSAVRAYTCADYAFTYSNGTYTALSGATTIFTGADSSWNNNVTLGFTFEYAGVKYTTMKVTSDGTINLGGTIGYREYANDLESTARNKNPIIAPIWTDLTSSARYKVTGTAPHRVMTVEWYDVKWKYDAATTNRRFQCKLYETSNKIEFIYDIVDAPTGDGASIGMNDLSGSYLSITPGATPTASSWAENDGITSNNGLTNGMTYIFTPPPFVQRETVADYTFSTNSGTYTPLTGDTSLFSRSDTAWRHHVNIGFPFRFAGQTYTKVDVQADGVISLGGTKGYNYNNNLDVVTHNNNPVIAVLWDDLSSAASYKLEGTEPNRVFIVQFSEMNYYNQPAAGSCQVRLYESDNHIEMIYDRTTNYVGVSATIGINDPSGHFLSVTPGATPTASRTTSNNGINSTQADTLENGVIYIFTPPTTPDGPGGVGRRYGTGSDRMALWLKADADVGATGNGGAVSWWGDQALGYPRSAHQYGAACPTLTNGVMNGHAAVRFENGGHNTTAGDRYLYLPKTRWSDVCDFSTDQKNTFFVVMRALTGGYHWGNEPQPYYDTGILGDTGAWYGMYLDGQQFETGCDSTINRSLYARKTGSLNSDTIVMEIQDGDDATIALDNGTKDTRTPGYTKSGGHNDTIFIGSNRRSSGHYDCLDGYISEIIMYKTVLNTAEQNLVSSYLGAKYGIAVTGNKYQGNDSAYINDVAGIGQESDGDHTEGASGGLVLTENNTSLADGEYVMAGHNGAAVGMLSETAPGQVDSRLKRIWYLDKTGSVDVTLSFNTSILDVPSAYLDDELSNLKLLYRSTVNGDWTMLSVAATVSGNTIAFDVDDADLADGYYTLGHSIGAPAPGNALDFDGVDDRVRLPNVSDLKFGADQDFTIEFWVKVPSSGRPSWPTYISNKNWDHGYYQGWGIFDDNTGKWMVNFKGADLARKDLKLGYIADDTWHHLAVTFDRDGEMKAYTDGELSGSLSIAGCGDVDTSYPITIASDGVPHYPGKFRMDEIRIWRTVRTARQIRDNMHRELTGTESGLVAYYRNDQTAGDAVADLSGNGYDGTLVNMDDSDWIHSYAVIEDAITDDYEQDLDAIWSGESVATNGGGLNLSATVSGVTNQVIFGHDNGAGTVTTDLPAGVVSRWNRVWAVEKRGTAAPTLTFDYGDAGIPGPTVFAGRHVLLYRSGTNGDFSVVTTANTIHGDQVNFSLSDAQLTNGYYTLGITEKPAHIAGNALEFDGVDDAVSIGQSGDLAFGAGDFTVEFWFRVKDADIDSSKWPVFVANKDWDGSGTQKGWMIGIQPKTGGGYTRGYICANIANGSARADIRETNQNFPILDDAWHHAAVVFNRTAGTMATYIDGRFDASVAIGFGSSIDTGDPIGVMADGNSTGGGGTTHIKGFMDALRFWNKALTLEEIRDTMHKQLVGNESGLAADYTFDATNGTTLADYAGGHDGTLKNMADEDWVTSYAVIERDVDDAYENALGAAWSGVTQSCRTNGLIVAANATAVSNYVVFGDNAAGAGTTTADLPSGATQRWVQVWSIEKVGTVAPTLTFDFGDAGNGTPKHYDDDHVLLYRGGTSGEFSIVAYGDGVSGDQVSFTLTDSVFTNGYYTLGLRDATPKTLTVGSGQTYATVTQALANAHNGDTIDIFGTVTDYNIPIEKDLTLKGQGKTATILQASSDGSVVGRRVLDVAAGKTVFIHDLTLRNGNLNGENGAGIRNAGTLTVSNCLITANTITGGGGDQGGGGIHNAAGATCTVLYSEISHNTVSSDGAGIDNKGTLTIRYSSIHDNSGAGGDPDGGGIDTGGSGVLTVEYSAIYSNSATWGGGVYGGGTFLVTTLYGNTASSRGGALTSWKDCSFNACTITANSCPDTGGINMKQNTCTLRNTIVAGNTDTSGGDYPDIRAAGGSIVSEGYNLIGDRHNQSFTATTGDQVGTAGSPIDAKLEPLADNGGPTKTARPTHDSPAVDQIPASAGGNHNGMPDTDQRLIARVRAYDVGACEYSLAQDLVVYLPFNNDYNDYSRSAHTNNAAVGGGAPTFTEGKFRQCVDFDGVDDYATFGAPADLNFGSSTDFTISFWFKVTGDQSGDPSIIGNKNWNSGKNRGWILCPRKKAAKDMGVNIGDGSNRADLNYHYFDYNEWWYCATVFDRDGNMTLYLGDPSGTINSWSTSISAIGNVDTPAGLAVNIAQDGTGSYGSWYDGSMDDLGIWRRALSTSEIQEIYTYGVNGGALGSILFDNPGSLFMFK